MILALAFNKLRYVKGLMAEISLGNNYALFEMLCVMYLIIFQLGHYKHLKVLGRLFYHHQINLGKKIWKAAWKLWTQETSGSRILFIKVVCRISKKQLPTYLPIQGISFSRFIYLTHLTYSSAISCTSKELRT